MFRADKQTLELVKPTRSFVTELSVKRMVKKNDISDWKLYLFNDIFVFAKMKTKDRYKFKGKIYLDLLRLVDVIDTDGSCSFSLI